MVNIRWFFFLFAAPHELTFLIISQNYSFSANLATELKQNILNQLRIEAFLNNNEVSHIYLLINQNKIGSFEKLSPEFMGMSHEWQFQWNRWWFLNLFPFLSLINYQSKLTKYLCISVYVYSLFSFVCQVDAVQQPKIILSHETFNSAGSWAITPILASSTEYIDKMILSSRSINTSQKTNARSTNVTSDAPSASPKAFQTKWLILCEDQSIVDLKALINNLKNEDYTKVSSILIYTFFFSFSLLPFVPVQMLNSNR